MLYEFEICYYVKDSNRCKKYRNYESTNTLKEAWDLTLETAVTETADYELLKSITYIRR